VSQFTITTRLFWGTDGTLEVQRYLQNLRLKKLAFVIDKNLKDLEPTTRLLSEYGENGFTMAPPIYFNASHEPTYDDLDQFVASFRTLEMDALIAVGGGSVLDITKGVGLLLKNPGKGIDYRGLDKVPAAGIPVICYPTTAGTGSEVTHTASFVDLQSKTKLGINGKHVAPLCGVLRPELTFSCPPKATLFSGLDAMVHSLEAVSAKTANAISILMGSKAFAMLYSNISKVITHPNDYAAREQMLLGSYYAGIAMMNVGGGPASGISYPLGVYFNVPHGIAGGIFLTHVMEFNVSHGYRGYIPIFDNLPGSELSLGEESKSADFVRRFKTLYAELKAPGTLSDYGIRKSDIPLITDLTLKQRKTNLELNPVPFRETDVTAILEKVIA